MCAFLLRVNCLMDANGSEEQIAVKGASFSLLFTERHTFYPRFPSVPWWTHPHTRSEHQAPVPGVQSLLGCHGVLFFLLHLREGGETESGIKFSLSCSGSLSHYLPLVRRRGSVYGQCYLQFSAHSSSCVGWSSVSPCSPHMHTFSLASLVVYYFRWHLSLHLPSLVTSAARPRCFKCSTGRCMLIGRGEDAK